MLYAKSNALPVAETTLGKVKKVSKPIAKFVLHILELWLSMNCRYVFTNMQQWGGQSVAEAGSGLSLLCGCGGRYSTARFG